MSEDVSDAIVLTLRYAGGRGQRFELEPRDDGAFDKTERVLTKGDTWHVANDQEIVEDIAIENTHLLDAGDDVRRHLTAALETVDTDDVDTRFHLRQALQLCDGVGVEAER